MSQFSETTRSSIHEGFLQLGYPDAAIENTYYTAQVRRGLGVCIAAMLGSTFIQFFPWGAEEESGHWHYTKHILSRAKGTVEQLRTDTVEPYEALGTSFIDKLPFMTCPADADLLTIKCLIEEGITNANHQTSRPDPATGEVVE
jgi:hypothetical protein